MLSLNALQCFLLNDTVFIFGALAKKKKKKKCNLICRPDKTCPLVDIGAM